MADKKEVNKYTPVLALIDDIPQINELLISFWGEQAVYDNSIYNEIFQYNLSYAYKKDSELIAICLVEFLEEEQVIYINLLGVKKGYQRKGFGRSLLEYCINNCIKEGYNDFFLHVAINNFRAKMLYRKLGFCPYKVVPNYYYTEKPPNNDAYLMRLNKAGKNDDKVNVETLINKRYGNSIIDNNTKNSDLDKHHYNNNNKNDDKNNKNDDKNNNNDNNNNKHDDKNNNNDNNDNNNNISNNYSNNKQNNKKYYNNTYSRWKYSNNNTDSRNYSKNTYSNKISKYN